MEMERAFAVQECRDEEKIRYAAYLLQGEAYNWCQRLQYKYEQDGEILIWERFQIAFYDQYFSRSIRIQKEQEFIYLKQKGMSVTEYEAKFTELAKFAPRLVDGEQERIHKFEMGLKTEIRKQMVPYKLTTYADVIKVDEDEISVIDITMKERDVREMQIDNRILLNDEDSKN
uniref:Uncharacterized protein LOC105054890 n=1 Tax=Elaeis guineensis var. tenera TaxID=51953 RepID=A0A6I9RYV8_ELAGV|nr:uncharacterized protein LOC105054890 [Elaeis guineensis]